MNIGHAIRICRQGRGYTLARLAERSRLSVSYLSLLEQQKREPTLATAQQIADGLSIPLSVLIFLAASKQELTGISEQQIAHLSNAIIGLMDDTTRQQSLF